MFAHYKPLLYTPACCFSRLYTLLCALVTVNTTYAIYFFLIHHCTNSLSSLHIFVHHCTFCASLHTKTSPAKKIRFNLKSKTSRQVGLGLMQIVLQNKQS